MDCKIRSRHIFVTALLVVGHVTEIATLVSSSVTATVQTTATATVSVMIPGSSTGIKNAPVTTTQTTTTPAPITCPIGTCNRSCSTFNSTGCPSNTVLGCTAKKEKDGSYTFSCDPKGCIPSANTVSCCSTSNCNPLAEKPPKSKATTMFGNLVSVTIIVMLANYM